MASSQIDAAVCRRNKVTANHK